MQAFKNEKYCKKIDLLVTRRLKKVIELKAMWKAISLPKRPCYVYRYSAKTSVQDVPLLFDSSLSNKSMPCQRRNSCPEVRRIGFVKSFHMTSGDFDLYPSILYLTLPPSTLGIRISSVEFVKNTIRFSAPQPQLDHLPTDTSQDTCPWRWTSLTASMRPSTSTTNPPNWLSLAPKHTGFEFSLRQGRSAINKIANRALKFWKLTSSVNFSCKRFELKWLWFRKSPLIPATVLKRCYSLVLV